MSPEVFTSGPFAGVSVTDAFARAAHQEEPVVVKLDPIAWPDGKGPVLEPLGDYQPGTKISALDAKARADVLLLLYTEYEIRHLLDVFTNNNAWTPARRAKWNPYCHNFAKYKASIQRIDSSDALKEGAFGYLSALKIGDKKVVLFKSELHPKVNGTALPFVPVLEQLVAELQPSLVISTGTAGAIGKKINCGDVAITARARFHCREHYPAFPDITTLTQNRTELTSTAVPNPKYLNYASEHLTKLSLPGLAKCYEKVGKRPGNGFLQKNVEPRIYTSHLVPPPAGQPMDIVSADFLTVDDVGDFERLQPLGVMNDTDDAFAFYAIGKLPAGQRPQWLSVRNASEPQIANPGLPKSTPPAKVEEALKTTAGAIYGVYQYCTTLNSAFACWAVVAGVWAAGFARQEVPPGSAALIATVISRPCGDGSKCVVDIST